AARGGAAEAPGAAQAWKGPSEAPFEAVADGRAATGAPTGAGALALFGFGTLASLFPFHSWAAPGYSAAPTPAAMLHAGALKKFGLYGLALLGLTSLRITEGALCDWLLWLALGNVTLIGFVCLTQVDLKRLVSWSSVAHMGPVFLGLWVAGARGSASGLDAAVLLMTAHGLSCAALFLLSNDVRARVGSYRFEDMGGLASRAPVLAAFFVAASMASLGLPGFANFWGEIGVFLSLRAEPLWIQALVASTVVITAVYTLRAAAAAFFGPASAALDTRAAAAPFGDLSWPSRVAAGLLLGASLTLGFLPSLVTDSTNRVSADVVKYVRPAAKTPSAR
ncbi:MAG: proton-conducting transporter membrane subunit, partial [Verrucomicrobiota bacterium]